MTIVERLCMLHRNGSTLDYLKGGCKAAVCGTDTSQTFTVCWSDALSARLLLMLESLHNFVNVSTTTSSYDYQFAL